VLAGAPGAGKSFLCYSLALSGATGAPFLGSALAAPFRTLYFDEENAPDDAAEYLRWCWNGLQKPSVAEIEASLWHFSFRLGRLRDGAEVYSFMRAVCAAYQPQLIVIDTATPCCRIADENDNAEASRAIRALRQVVWTSAPDATIIVLKHLRIDHDSGYKDVRGAKAWSGEADGVIFLERARGRPFKLLNRAFSATRLYPQKTRAFGLGEPLRVTPAESSGGIILTAAPESTPPPKRLSSFEPDPESV